MQNNFQNIARSFYHFNLGKNQHQGNLPERTFSVVVKNTTKEKKQFNLFSITDDIPEGLEVSSPGESYQRVLKMCVAKKYGVALIRIHTSSGVKYYLNPIIYQSHNEFGTIVRYNVLPFLLLNNAQFQDSIVDFGNTMVIDGSNELCIDVEPESTVSAHFSIGAVHNGGDNDLKEFYNQFGFKENKSPWGIHIRCENKSQTEREVSLFDKTCGLMPDEVVVSCPNSIQNYKDLMYSIGDSKSDPYKRELEVCKIRILASAVQTSRPLRILPTPESVVQWSIIPEVYRSKYQNMEFVDVEPSYHKKSHFIFDGTNPIKFKLGAGEVIDFVFQIKKKSADSTLSVPAENREKEIIPAVRNPIFDPFKHLIVHANNESEEAVQFDITGLIYNHPQDIISFKDMPSEFSIKYSATYPKEDSNHIGKLFNCIRLFFDDIEQLKYPIVYKRYRPLYPKNAEVDSSSEFKLETFKIYPALYYDIYQSGKFVDIPINPLMPPEWVLDYQKGVGLSHPKSVEMMKDETTMIAVGAKSKLTAMLLWNEECAEPTDHSNIWAVQLENLADQSRTINLFDVLGNAEYSGSVPSKTNRWNMPELVYVSSPGDELYDQLDTDGYSEIMEQRAKNVAVTIFFDVAVTIFKDGKLPSFFAIKHENDHIRLDPERAGFAKFLNPLQMEPRMVHALRYDNPITLKKGESFIVELPAESKNIIFFVPAKQASDAGHSDEFKLAGM